MYIYVHIFMRVSLRFWRIVKAGSVLVATPMSLATGTALLAHSWKM